MRTAQQIEERKSSGESQGSTQPTRKIHPNSLANLRPKPWKKGQSGNPGGKPGIDLAAKMSRQFFERHEEIGPDMSKELKGFNAYAFGVLADRAYGKVKDRVELTDADGKPLELTVKMVK